MDIRSVRRRVTLAMSPVLAAALLPYSSWAALFTLTDANSVSQFDTASQVNNYAWSVDGVNQLASEAFWFRIGNTAEQAVESLPIALQGATDNNFDGNPDTLFVRYSGAGFRIDIKYSLAGGTPGSGNSDLSEQISIVNQSATPLDFHFFEYADFDLLGSPSGDSAVFTNLNTVLQTKGSSALAETVLTPVASHREIAFFPNTLNSLNDGSPTTLSDTPLNTVVGPGDVTWAYQWDMTLQTNSTYQISKDKNIVVTVPEPASLSLLMIAAGLFIANRPKRKSV